MDPHDPSANGILGRLPPPNLARLLPHLEHIHFNGCHELGELTAPLQYAYFPTTAAFVWMVQEGAGLTAEVSIVGRDGMMGIAALAPPHYRLYSPSKIITLVPGDAFRIPIRKLGEAADADPLLRTELLGNFAQRFFHIAQIAFCNRVHTLEQQFIRFLLCWQDLADTPHLHLTHEQISNLLGVRREAISQAGAKLQRAGLVKFRRGMMTVLDRAGLEARACDCYASIVQNRTQTGGFTGRLPGTVKAAAAPSTVGAALAVATPLAGACASEQTRPAAVSMVR